MLVQLLIQDIVLIDRLDIEFNSNLSVLTGETGAGKSILLDALSLALGARGDGGLVRISADKGDVQAVFNISTDQELFRQLEAELSSAFELPQEDGFCEIILRRSQSNDGRTRAFINNNPVPVSMLRNIGQMLVEIHGQHDDRALVDEEMHRQFLDAYGGLEHECELVANAWNIWRKSIADYSALKKSVEEGAREAKYLRSSVEELEQLGAESGEETLLADRRQLMMQAQNIAGELSEAEEILSGNNSAAPILASLARKLERKTQQVPGLLEDVIAQIDGALNHLYAAQSEMDAAINKSEYDPQVLDSTEERLFALRASARKFNVAPENLPDLATKLADQLNNLDHGEAKLSELKQRSDGLEEEYLRLAEILSDKRKSSAEILMENVNHELPSLKLEQAEFLVKNEIGSHLACINGIDQIEFWVRTNPGTKPGPMFKVASGGELSRFLLALKVVLAEKGSAPTLVFDEIDTGVGGAVADAIGRRLTRLAEKVQVLSVTHAPQVAAQAEYHFLISKSATNKNDDLVITKVEMIDTDARRDEIARMLAGATITPEAKAAADRLLEN